MAEQFDPYYKWLGIRPEEQPPNHYRLLSVDLFEPDADVLDAAANRQAAFLRQYGSGPHGEFAQKLLNEVSEAQICLLVPEKKAAYDKELRATIAARTAPIEPVADKKVEIKPVEQVVIAPPPTRMGGADSMSTTTEPKPIPVERKAAPKKLTKEDVSSLYQISLQLMEKFDYVQTIDILQGIPKSQRSKSVQKLYERAINLEEQAKALTEQMNEAATQFDDSTAEKAAKQLLKLKPGHQGAKKLLRDATQYGTGGSRRRRRNQAVDGYKAIGFPAMILMSSVGAVVIGVALWGLMQLSERETGSNEEEKENVADVATPANGTGISVASGNSTKTNGTNAGTGPFTNAPAMAVAPFDAAQAKQHQQAWADYLNVQVEETNSIGMKLAIIPPGEFKMGPRTNVPVTLTRPVRIGIHEVTQGQWQAIMGTEPWKGRSSAPDGPNIPANYVSWEDATAFCEKLTGQERAAGRIAADEEYRLPTEAEWECACRAGTTTDYSFGDDSSQLAEYAWFDENTEKVGEAYAHPVGLKRPNQWGLYDIHGNVAEWCQDVPTSSFIGGRDPVVTEGGTDRIVRGSHRAFPAKACMVRERGTGNTSHQSQVYGFRVVKSLAPPQSKPPAPTPAPTPGSGSPKPAVAPFDATQAKQHQQAWADYLHVQVEETNSIGMKLTIIPPCEFKMGPRANVPVTLTQPIRIGIYEVTQGQWQAVMGTEPWKGKSDLREGPDFPACYVSTADAEAFCQKLTEQERTAGRITTDAAYRLPTSAEWEWACRAGTMTESFFGDDESQLADYAWFDANSLKAGEAYAHAVGLKRQNPFGIFDLYGNVSEWCQDNDNKSLPGGRDPLVIVEGLNRINRGGHWRSSAKIGKSTESRSADPTYRGQFVGFRVARTLPLPTPAP